VGIVWISRGLWQWPGGETPLRAEGAWVVAGSTAGLWSYDLYACRLWGDGLSPGRG
jgi:hypothetical protein